MIGWTRCHRLHKLCAQQVPAPPRAKKEPRPTKVAQLERRLDDLTSQLEAAQTGSPFPRLKKNKQLDFTHIFPSPDPPAAEDELMPSASESAGDEVSSSSASRRPSAATRWPSEASWRPDPGSQPAGTCSVWPSDKVAHALVEWYREVLQPLFPFVIPPPHMSSAELKQQRPFLWKGIVMGAAFLDGPRQIAMGNEMANDIGKAAFGKLNARFDLMQGVLMLLAW